MTRQHRNFLCPALSAVGVLAFTAAGTSGALACRGTAEYPEVAARLVAAPLSTSEQADLARTLDEGRVLHDRAHRQDDRGMMEESLKILDRVKDAL